ncbi:ATP-binding protein [Niveibacterium sp.]|uniref:ATP-binding protein n=1 Tax=Niveibacterium sp. TaxID=2017444 RepID=UPI0035AE61E5
MSGLIEPLSRRIDRWTSTRVEALVGLGGLAVVVVALFAALSPFQEAREAREREALALTGRAATDVQRDLLRMLDVTDFVLDRAARRVSNGVRGPKAVQDDLATDLRDLLGGLVVFDQRFRLMDAARGGPRDAALLAELSRNAAPDVLDLMPATDDRLYAVRVWSGDAMVDETAPGGVVAEISKAALREILSVHTLRGGGEAFLLRRNGDLLAHSSVNGPGVPVRLPDALRKAIEQGQEAEFADADDSRLFALRRLAEYPLVVVVALDAATVRSAVGTPGRIQGWGFLLLAGFALGTTLMLMGATRSMRRARLRGEQESALFEASPDPMLLVRRDTDGDFQCERINPVARRLFRAQGRSGDVPIGELSAGETLRRALEHIANQTRHSIGAFDLSVPLEGDSAQVEISVVTLPASEDRLPRFAIIGRELTAQRQAERALRERSLQLEAIIDSAMDAVLITDASRRIVMYNKAAENMFGYRAEDTIGEDVLMLLPERYRSLPAEKILLQARRRASWRLRGGARPLLGRRRNGEEFPLELALSRVELGDATLFTLILRDITEQVGAELEISVLNDSLEQRVIERTAELQRAYKEMEAFSYSVSHDLRAPLRAIHGYTFLLIDSEGERLTDEGRGLLDRVMKASVRMGELIDDFLDFSRVGRAELTRQKVDMGRLAAEVVADLRGPYPDTRISVGLLPPAYGDPRLLRQVWVNLIGNALKFSSHGNEPRVDIGVTQAGGQLRYYVSDNGIGFDMNYADKLFGVFQRLHASREFEGTGIGLAIVKRIVERHMGEVAAEGAPGQGATISFTIP